MRQETLSIVLSGVAAATGVVSIYLFVWHDRQRSREREEDRRLLEEELALWQSLCNGWYRAPGKGYVRLLWARRRASPGWRTKSRLRASEPGLGQKSR